jgi:hypothetical protein
LADDTNPEPTIPKARFDQVVQERRDALARIAALEAQVGELTPYKAKADNHAAELSAWQAKEAAWGDERTILAAGITDPDGVDFARHAWGRVKAEDRPAGGLKDWLADAGKLPKAVQAYLPSAPAQAPAAGAASGQSAAPVVGAPAAPAGLPRANAGVVPGTNASGKLTAEQIRAYADQAAAGTLPMAEWKQISADVLAGRR